MTKRIKKWQTWLLVAMLLAISFWFWEILSNFSFVYVDGDQTTMWYGAYEFLHGRFHQPCFFGQAYGSMTESYVSLVFAWLPSHIALPLASFSLFLTPYIVFIINSREKWRSALISIGFLALMPVQYAMLGTMPRDFVSGAAIASLAMLVLENRKNYSLFITSFLVMVAWSVNHGSVLLGVPILVLKFLDDKIGFKTKTVFGCAGAVLGLLIHFAKVAFFWNNPEYNLHHAWAFEANFATFLKGVSHLDPMLGMITPLFKNQGVIYPLAFVALLIYFLKTDHKAESTATLALMVVFLFSLSVTKTHDGYPSIYSSHERMFMALPPSLLMLLLRVKWTELGAVAISFVAVGYFGYHFGILQTTIIKEVGNNHLLIPAKVDDLEKRISVLKEITDTYEPEGVIIGPNCDWLTVFGTGTGFMINDQIPIVFPSYERKTWDMRKMDQHGYDRILWITDSLQIPEEYPDVQIDTVYNKGLVKVLLVEGFDFNPIDIYKQFGYKVSDH